jgi:hypothetical protein
MRTHDMPWSQFFEKVKQLAPEEPFTSGLSNDSNARVNESLASIPKKRPPSVFPLRRIRKDP